MLALKAGCLAALSSTLASGLSLQETCQTQLCYENAVSFAYTYGFGLYAYGDLTKTITNATTNTFFHSRDLANPGSIGVVRPNADTLYSTFFIDLSSSDVVLTIPTINQSRYWVVPFYTPYGDNLVNLGSITNSTPGDYLVRYDADEYGLQSTENTGGYQGIITMPTSYGVVLMRILASPDEEDVQKVRDIQDQFKVALRPRFDTPVAPALNLSSFSDPEYLPVNNQTLYQAVMKLTAKYAPYNQPHVIQDRSWVSTTLENAGCVDGNFILPKDVNLTVAVATANWTLSSLLATPGINVVLGTNWTTRDSRAIGNYNSLYTMRYGIAIRGYLALVQGQAIYPNVLNDIQIKDGQAVLVNFHSRPHIRRGGFWSLTAYNTQNYLVENSLERYSLGDRSNLTFPDGRALSTGDDGPFQILMQDSKIEPPSNWTSNWLPIQSGATSVQINLRWYGGEPSMVNGSYVYPDLIIVDAIRG